MAERLPGILITGASGFVGRHFVQSAAGRYRLFCLARRSRQEAGVPDFENMRWTQVDISDWDRLRAVVGCVKDHGGVDFVLHLASYYDFTNREHPAYRSTNVEGTRNVLELARQLEVKRFLFASSTTVCEFPPLGQALTEESVGSAEFPYARSKREGEELVRIGVTRFPVAIVRMAAIFSDWCEYPPLYVFLRTWLSRAWNARILAGEGRSAVPYLHVNDLIRLYHSILDRTDELPELAVFNASPDEVVTHRELYDAAVHFYFGEDRPPQLWPRWLLKPGVYLRWKLGVWQGTPPFEAPWMLDYVDRQLRVDASQTRRTLDWAPAPRLEVTRRLLVMIENLKSRREVWNQINLAALTRVSDRPNLMVAAALDDLREELTEQVIETINDPANASRLPGYQRMDRDVLSWYVTLFYQILATAVRTRDRQLVRQHAQIIAYRRRNEGFQASEMQVFLDVFRHVVTEALRERPELKGLEQAIHDHVTLTCQLTADDVADVFDTTFQPPPEVLGRYQELNVPHESADLERVVHELQDICGDIGPLYSGSDLPSRPVGG